MAPTESSPDRLRIPADLLPADGRFGSGPSKVRAEAAASVARAPELGTSHRQAPVRALVGRVRESLAALHRAPDGYELALGNGGSSQFWDIAVCGLIERRSSHAVFGEFSAKFARAAESAPHLQAPQVRVVEPGEVALPDPAPGADAYAWPQNETSTGAAAPVRRIADDGALVLVDATSAAGAMDVDLAATDAWYFAPQKNLGSDGGLWLSFLSPAAIERAYQLRASGRWIPASLDLVDAIEQSRKNQTTNTPAVATLLMLAAQLDWLQERGGLDFAVERTRDSSGRVYAWAERHPLASPFVADPAHRSPVVATIDFAGSVDAKALAATLRANGIVDVEPYRKLGRNQLRIGTYAAVDPDDVTALCACLDWVLERIAQT
ncbi:phosphoserine transaminase [Naumannella huperziae]